MNAFLIVLSIAALMVLLYQRGLISVKMGRALVFVGTIYSARYKSFHGTIRRVFRPAENKTYRFSFSSQLNSGSAEIEILDKKNQVLLHLQGMEQKELYLEQGEKYLIVLRCRSADGAHHLEWE
ncbi:MAG: hypothetical protein J6A26_06160 [Oscillospiraceae bacterium]|nr:hypothetical protein [Oscillospiraceae bacterium]